MKTTEVTATFTNGRPRYVKGVMVMRGADEWDRFMRFMERCTSADVSTRHMRALAATWHTRAPRAPLCPRAHLLPSQMPSRTVWASARRKVSVVNGRDGAEKRLGLHAHGHGSVCGAAR